MLIVPLSPFQSLGFPQHGVLVKNMASRLPLPRPLQSLKSSCLPPDGSIPPTPSFSPQALTQGHICRLASESLGSGQELSLLFLE